MQTSGSTTTATAKTLKSAQKQSRHLELEFVMINSIKMGA